MFAIYKKELRSFFINPIGYVYTGAFLGLAALICCYTTIMSSMAAGANHIDHVKTQLPYAAVAAVASFLGYLIVGFTGMNAFVGVAVAIVIMLAIYFAACKLFGAKKAA